MVKRSLLSEAVLAWVWRRRAAAALEGAEVTIASSRQERVDAALGELPDGCVGSALDVRDEAQVAALFERVGEFDHLAFTAGDAFMPRPLADLGLSDARARSSTFASGARSPSSSTQRPGSGPEDQSG